MSAATIVAEAFGEGANLYTDVLALSSAGPEVSPAQLRKAYYKRALLYHPDKQRGSSRSEIEDAKAKFQAVSVAYSILSNRDSRAEYDESGELYEEGDDGLGEKSGTEAWEEYFRGIFGKVTVEDIDKFEAQYKCSDEEEKDVLRYYKQFKGDMDKMLECVMLSRDVDKKRWVEDYIKPAIEKGDAKHYKEQLERTMGDCTGGNEEDDEETESEEDSEDEKEGTKTKSRKKPTKKTLPKKKGGYTKHKVGKSPAKKKDKSTGCDPNEDLVAAIRGRAVARSEASFNAMLNGLEERYSSGKKRSKGKKTSGGGRQPEIPDDEFEKIQARLMKNRKGKRK